MDKRDPLYYRRYRVVRGMKKQRQAVQEGVELCCKLLRDVVGEQTVTGNEAAKIITKTLSVQR